MKEGKSTQTNITCATALQVWLEEGYFVWFFVPRGSNLKAPHTKLLYF